MAICVPVKLTDAVKVFPLISVAKPVPISLEFVFPRVAARLDKETKSVSKIVITKDTRFLCILHQPETRCKQKLK